MRSLKLGRKDHCSSSRLSSVLRGTQGDHPNTVLNRRVGSMLLITMQLLPASPACLISVNGAGRRLPASRQSGVAWTTNLHQRSSLRALFR